MSLNSLSLLVCSPPPEVYTYLGPAGSPGARGDWTGKWELLWVPLRFIMHREGGTWDSGKGAIGADRGVQLVFTCQGAKLFSY